MCLRDTHEVGFDWVNMKQLNFFVSGPKFTKFSGRTWEEQ